MNLFVEKFLINFDWRQLAIKNFGALSNHFVYSIEKFHYFWSVTSCHENAVASITLFVRYHFDVFLLFDSQILRLMITRHCGWFLKAYLSLRGFYLSQGMTIHRNLFITRKIIWKTGYEKYKWVEHCLSSSYK